LAETRYLLRTAWHRAPASPLGRETTVVGEIGSTTEWGAAVEGVDAIVHLAGRAHRAQLEDAEEERLLEVNARGTLSLARAAARAGVKRFILLSSIKVNGDGESGHSYAPSDEPRPSDAYGRSKWLAERFLKEVTAATAMEGVIVRPPLVYGSGVRANFLRLMRWVDRGWPLPFGRVANARSLVGVWNLCDLVLRLLEHPGAPGGTWMVSDGEDISTPDLVRRLSVAMRRRVRLLSVPVWALRACAGALGRAAEVGRLCDSLTVDIAATRRELGWSPPMSLEAGLVRTVSWYLETRPAP
jgi:nucleoside-diphosphate-sugar epimerase